MNGILRFNFFYDYDSIRQDPFVVVELLTEDAYVKSKYSYKGNGTVSLITTTKGPKRKTTLHFRFEDRQAQRILYDVLRLYIKELEAFRTSENRTEEQEYVNQHGYGMMKDSIGSWHDPFLNYKPFVDEKMKKQAKLKKRVNVNQQSQQVVRQIAITSPLSTLFELMFL